MTLPIKGEHFKILGRTEAEGDALVLSYTNSELAFAFHGKKLSIDMESRWAETSDFKFVAVAVYLDDSDDPYMRFFLEGRQNVVIFDSDQMIDVQVHIVKISEATYGSILFYSAQTDGSVTPLPYSDRRIEFIGDSITCGFGVEGAQTDPFLPEQENGYKTYAYLTAKALCADAHCVSWSGKGVYSNYTPAKDGDPEQRLLMPVIYSYASVGWYRTKYNSTDITDGWNLWDFGRFRPDVIVVYLGTNDASYTGKSRKRQIAFKDRYIAFLKVIREQNPSAQLLCLTGVMTGVLTRVTENAVRELAKQDKKLHFLKLPRHSADTYGIGGCGHPNASMNRVMAELVTKRIKSILHW